MKIDPRLLLAEGDSWFSYPKDPADVLDLLDDEVFGYRIYNDASMGDTLEEMANDPRQRKRFRVLIRILAKKQRIPIAILLSGGGNDIVRKMDTLIHDKRLGEGILNHPKVDELIDQVLYSYYLTVIDYMTNYSQKYFSRTVPILVHGYAYIVPDGRGKRDADGKNIGWVKKVLFKKRHRNLQKNTAATQELIDKFNRMVKTVSQREGFEHVSYINLRDCASNGLVDDAYKLDWRDELHLWRRGLKSAARRFDKAIRSVERSDPEQETEKESAA